MYIGLKNIQREFQDLENLLLHSDGIHCLTEWEDLNQAPAPYHDHVLYVCAYTPKLQAFPYPEHIHLCCIVTDDTGLEEASRVFPQSASLLLVRAADPDEICLRLQQYFHIQCGTAMYAQTLLEFLNFENGLQPAIEYSYSVFQNPVFVFDTNYNLVAATWDAIRELGLQDSVLVKRHFSSDDFKMVNRENHIHSRVQKSEIPIRAFNEELGYEQMYCAIDTAKDLGHIVVSAVHKPFCPIDTEFMLMLKKYVNQQLRKDSFISNSRGFNYEFFLRDLLDKKIATDRAYLEHMNYVNRWFSGNMYVMVVETARGASTVSPVQIRNIIESRVPNTKTFAYTGQIIAVLNIHSKDPLPETHLAAAREICSEFELYTGLSNGFSDILQFEEFYNQALRAIELGASKKNIPGLYLYQDYYLDHITTIFKLNESPDTFCHPKMKFLLDYDREHNSEFAYTLYMYLANERNLATTSEAMHMHRSSLVYRFKKITALIGDDNWDYRERLYLMLSYEMHQ